MKSFHSCGLLILGVLMLHGACSLHGQEEADFSMALGLGAAAGPPARGVDKTIAYPLPYLAARYRDRLTVGTEGLLLNLLPGPKRPTAQALFCLLPHPGRSEALLPRRLRGLNGIPPTIEWGFRGGLTLFNIIRIDALVAADLLNTGHKGARGETGLSLLLPVKRLKLLCAVRVALVGGDDAYMQSLYGVSGQQAAATGLSEYSPGVGLEGLTGSLSVRRQWSTHWKTKGTVSWIRFQGAARQSPVVETAGHGSLNIVAAYVF